MTEVDICNKAISLLGGTPVESSDGTVANITTESLEANLCKAQYETIRDNVLEDRVWAFTIKRVQLDSEDPVPDGLLDGQYFAIPADCLNVWRLRISDTSLPENQPEWRREGQYVRALATSFPSFSVPNQVIMEYIERITDTTQYPAKFIDALSLRLALEFTIAITQNNTLFQLLKGEYEQRLVEASAVETSQGTRELFRSTTLTRVR